MGPLPPVANVDKLKSELALVPLRHREDALQEAWLAHLSGEDAAVKVSTYRRRETRLEKRQVPIETTDDGQAIAMERDGSHIPLVSDEVVPAITGRMKFTPDISAPQQTNSSAGSIRRNSLGRAG